jgi:hypothetical protein
VIAVSLRQRVQHGPLSGLAYHVKNRRLDTVLWWFTKMKPSRRQDPFLSWTGSLGARPEASSENVLQSTPGRIVLWFRYQSSISQRTHHDRATTRSRSGKRSRRRQDPSPRLDRVKRFGLWGSSVTCYAVSVGGLRSGSDIKDPEKAPRQNNPYELAALTTSMRECWGNGAIAAVQTTVLTRAWGCVGAHAQFCDQSPSAPEQLHPGVVLRANLKPISHRCHLFEVAFAWELTKETFHLPLGCLQGGLDAPEDSGSPLTCTLTSREQINQRARLGRRTEGGWAGKSDLRSAAHPPARPLRARRLPRSEMTWTACAYPISRITNNYAAQMWNGFEEGSCLRLTDFCITQL